jgi:hypothetical protein
MGRTVGAGPTGPTGAATARRKKSNVRNYKTKQKIISSLPKK